MKKLIPVFVLTLLTLSFFTASAGKTNKNTRTTGTKSAVIEVYYFHFTHRCVTCLAVEAESQKDLTALYPKEVKSGKIKFTGVNLDDKGSDIAAKRCKAEGQALLVISGGKRIDLTEQGFMYARSNPDKLKSELKKVIDALI
jgi:hypothetical protein